MLKLMNYLEKIYMLELNTQKQLQTYQEQWQQHINGLKASVSLVDSIEINNDVSTIIIYNNDGCCNTSRQQMKSMMMSLPSLTTTMYVVVAH